MSSLNDVRGIPTEDEYLMIVAAGQRRKVTRNIVERISI